MAQSDDGSERLIPARKEQERTSAPHEFRGHWISVILLMLTVLTVGFGFCGFTQLSLDVQRRNESTAFDWTIPAYRTVQLLILNSGTEEPGNINLAIARVLAAGTFLFLTGAVAFRVFHDSTQLPVRMTRAGHTVICGLGEIGMQLFEDLHRARLSHRVVIIECDENNVDLDRVRRLGADVVIGDATRSENLRRARAHCAATVFAVTRDDGANLEITAELAAILQKQPQVRRRRGSVVPLRVALHLQDVKLAEAFRTLSSRFPAAELLDLSIFSVARTSATQLVTKWLWPFAPKSTGEVAHFVILGFDTMGRALAVTLARLGHFPNRKRSRFTIADHDSQRRAREFVSRFGHFTAWNAATVGVSRFDAARDEWSSRMEGVPPQSASEFPDAIDYVANAQFRDLPPDLGDECFARELLDSFIDPQVTVKPAIFLCLKKDQDNFDAVVRLRETLDRLGGTSIPIFVWLPQQPALAQVLSIQPTIIPFGSCRETTGLDEVLHPQHEPLARAVHRHYEHLAVQENRKSNPVGWNEIREEMRESNRQLADHFDVKLAALGWKLVDHLEKQKPTVPAKFPEMDEATALVLAEMEHNRWVAERLMAGWRYSPKPATEVAVESNKLRKLHHDLVPWSKLGHDQRIDVVLLQAILNEAQRGNYRLEPLA